MSVDEVNRRRRRALKQLSETEKTEEEALQSSGCMSVNGKLFCKKGVDANSFLAMQKSHEERKVNRRRKLMEEKSWMPSKSMRRLNAESHKLRRLTERRLDDAAAFGFKTVQRSLKQVADLSGRTITDNERIAFRRHIRRLTSGEEGKKKARKLLAQLDVHERRLSDGDVFHSNDRHLAEIERVESQVFGLAGFGARGQGRRTPRQLKQEMQQKRTAWKVHHRKRRMSMGFMYGANHVEKLTSRSKLAKVFTGKDSNRTRGAHRRSGAKLPAAPLFTARKLRKLAKQTRDAHTQAFKAAGHQRRLEANSKKHVRASKAHTRKGKKAARDAVKAHRRALVGKGVSGIPNKMRRLASSPKGARSVRKLVGM
jgi:hypothetical protein